MTTAANSAQKRFIKQSLAIALSAALMSGCGQQSVQPATDATAVAGVEAKANAQSPSDKANALFEDIFMASVMRSPMYQTYMGIKQDQDKWDDISEQAEKRELEFAKRDLAKIKALDPATLDTQTKLSRQLYIEQLENEIADYQWRFHTYPVNQMSGYHSQLPAFLINMHRVDNIDDAKAYIKRLEAVEPLMVQLVENIRARAEKGIVAPDFILPYVINDSRNLLKGAPFDDGEDSTLLADFRGKVAKLEVSQQDKEQLIAQAKQALSHQVKRGYEQLIDYLEVLVKTATSDAGAWKFPDGERFYDNALKRTTSTDLSADAIHNIGLDEVARIHQQMRQIMKKVGFEGDLQSFFQFMKNDKQFYYDETETGRAAYLTEATVLIDDMKSRLDQLFILKPKAALDVKAVEPFREQSAGKAFYQRPALDGSRPGRYYVNLYRMSDMPTYQMAALAYHEGIPGHHMQIAIANELEGIPKFRRYGKYTAYVEGWGLYAELLPKEIGLYQDPYADFGRLAMELWRACRLVVDTGIHAKKWTREQAIDYLLVNTPNPEGDVIKAIDRYIVMPSQATAYKIGMLKIVELREKAKKHMKERFDIRQFHEVVLKNGPLPLNVLSQKVDEYIKQG